MSDRPRRRATVPVAVASGLLLAMAGCGGGGDQGSGPPSGPVVVTFEVIDERFKALLTEPADIDTARRLLAGDDFEERAHAPSIPNGRIVRETGVNEGYSWSLDSNDIEFAEITIEGCDGLPSDVETKVLTSDRYCPWAAVVLAIEPAG